MRNAYLRNMNIRSQILTPSGEYDTSPPKTVVGGSTRLAKPEDGDETKLAIVWVRSRFHFNFA
jgi:hypothetical protein